ATFSSDLVFDGAAGRAYVEQDAPRPLNVYGKSKAVAERKILAMGGEALVIAHLCARPRGCDPGPDDRRRAGAVAPRQSRRRFLGRIRVATGGSPGPRSRSDRTHAG